MYRYSDQSYERLKTAHPALQTVFLLVSQQIDTHILCGHRDEARQQTAVATGKSKVSFPNSKHNRSPSHAIDAIPAPIDWQDTARIRAFAATVLHLAEQLKAAGLIAYSLRWGGDWDGDGDTTDQTFNDLVHFEIKEEP